MTSNIGSQYILDEADESKRERLVNAAISEHFRPEFLNRLTETVIFRRLSEANLTRIVDLQLVDVSKRLADRRITLTLTAAARADLAARGYDPAFGARPLRRLIEREVINPLATQLLSGNIRDGQAVTIDLTPEGLVPTAVESA
jgi:ATP-dependent Clp protease ATP-binding subunit ClpB